jgi:hypothetical protein
MKVLSLFLIFFLAHLYLCAVKCDDESSCDDGQTCCLMPDKTYGCCPYDDATCCLDGESCCPNGYTCKPDSDECNPQYTVSLANLLLQPQMKLKARKLTK